MKDRIAAVRQEFGLTQTEFGESIGITQNYVWMLESGKRVPSKRILNAISQHFGVNLEWLETGSGMMIQPKTVQQELAAFVGELLADKDDSIKRRWVHAISKLDANDLRIVERVAREILKNSTEV